MNEKYMRILWFLAGSGVGALVTWKYAEKKYSALSEIDIKSVKESMKERIQAAEEKINALEEENKVFRANPELVEAPKDDASQKDKSKSCKEKPDLTEYAKVANGYTKYGSRHKSPADDEPLPHPDDDGEDEGMKSQIPYVITPDLFGETFDYDQISLIYYADGVLTDDNDQPVEDIANTVGVDFASHFGEYEDDSVFIRNDVLKNEYEILADRRSYSDIIKRKPHRVD